MMKRYCFFAVLTAILFSVVTLSAAEQPVLTIYETPREFFGRGDFDGDGGIDLVIVDKESGKCRLGYLAEGGLFSWADSRPTGLKGVTGFSIGKLFADKSAALVLTSPDANAITLVEASSRMAPGKAISAPFTAGLGPNSLVAIEVGGTGKTAGLMDLYVSSIYNSPDANLATLLRNDGAEFPKISDNTLPGAASKANRLALKSGQPEVVCELITEDAGDTFRAEDVQSGKAATVASLAGLPSGCDYTVGNFRGSPLRDFVFYRPGQSKLMARPVEEAGGKVQLGKGADFDLGQPVMRVVALTAGTPQRLLVIFGEGQKAGVFNFDGAKAPISVHALQATNDLFTCAASLPDGFVIFTQPPGGKLSTKYQTFKSSGEGYVPGAYGTLPTLAENDNFTIPDIRARIVANGREAQESEMKLYTNTIPGTRVSYVMVPIPGGEFTMGSAEGEAERKPDEGPQHKVKIEPFWMGRCEITWSEYELFMYPEEERRMRATNPSDAGGDKLADAVTHPSRPYVEMSFGMGKEGYPAISMTHHAANKYCQWLSAKTGQFYRLPTEAEWEYACRAGTTTAYFFGDDASKLPEYGWFEQNSDFKYQKVGKKKPNPWGLCDMCGNVLEWCLDQYDPEYYKACAAKGTVLEPWNKATKPYPHVARGGSWDDEAKACRSAARRGSERAWKMTDPQLPKSIWYLSDAQWVGFRIIRPLKVPPAEEMQKYWTSGTERD